MKNLIKEIEKTAKNLEVYSKTHFLPKVIREDISTLNKVVDEIKKVQEEEEKEF